MPLTAGPPSDRPNRGGVVGRSARAHGGWSVRRGVLGRLAGRGADDRGAVATVVAVLLAGGVLLGFLALVVDIGQIAVERAELQSGADAAVLAVARACAAETAKCASYSAIQSEAAKYANNNAPDGVSNLVDVCGRFEGTLPACDPPDGAPCLGTEPGDTTRYVEVRLSTELPDGRFVLPPSFAQAMAGNGGYAGVSVGACARATFERQADVKVIAMTVSVCEFNEAGFVTSGPPYASTSEIVIDFLFNAHGQCAFDPPGPFWHEADAAGWLTGGDANCLVDLPSSGEVWGEPLEPDDFLPPAGCPGQLGDLETAGTPVWVPVHDGHHHSGVDVQYRNVSVAPFVVTGYYFGPGRVRPSNITGDPPCETETPPDFRRCVSGVFVGPAQPLSTLNGASIIKLVG
jgi:hypothetical protein